MTVTRDDVLASLRAMAETVAAHKDYLTELDASIGDADHGVNLDRGFRAALAKLSTVEEKDVGAILKAVGLALVGSVGGASGPLYGTFFMRLGAAAANKQELTAADLAAMFEAGVKGVSERGKAGPGEKTMLDALQPAAEALRRAADDRLGAVAALGRAAAAAAEGMEATVPMKALKGRASYLRERSIGHQDPGATSAYLLLKALADTLAARRSESVDR